ncbi:N-formylglutamate amidohydrolase [Rhodopila globiformis]|uniref:N-formylglutamate amidohydrolase n=1 Tax=Rhodopila globiformis TaxID=1071 RepID=A0A2S6N2N1_RHOGL|nr:N-formylglutamate amidohydrolase [Rhodopila globiformis]PPQ28874.1 N-formylglutamate amidohydrolase [Rhodopila globiformis]
MPEHHRLLTASDPAPVRVLRENGTSDIFLTADHAGWLIPAALGDLGVPAAERLRHIAWDIGIAGVTERLSELLDATAILQAYSRLVIDCNRHPSWDSAMPEISEYTVVPGNRTLTEADKAARAAAIFTPYHDRIRALLDARAHRRTVLIAMHSFTPSFKGESRAMQIGVLYDKDPRLANILLDLLRQEGDLIVGDNAPYALGDHTDYSVPTHGHRRGLAHVEIEIRQDLIAEPEGQVAWARRLARLFTAADERLKAA